jgi:hypothetical protein
MAEEQKTSTRRRVLETIGAAGAVAVAGCTSTSSSPASGESEDDGSETGGSEEQGKTGQDGQENSGDEENNQDQASELEQNIREGIPLDGLGAYTDQMLEARETSDTAPPTEKVNAILEGESVEEQRDALVEALTEENYEMLFSEYHRQKGANGDTENQVVLNRNWSFTSDFEPIFEFYLVENGELQSQPVILDPDPETNNRQVNRPGSGEPEYLADLRDSTDGAQSVPEDYDALQELISFYNEHEDNPEKMINDARATTFDKMSASIFGVDPEENFIFYDGESANLVANGKFEGSKEGIEAVVGLSNSLPEGEGYGEDIWTSAEYTERGWEFRTHPDWELGQKLPGEQ